MPFGVVSGVGRGMGVLDRRGDRRREGVVLEVNLGRPIVTSKDVTLSYHWSCYCHKYLHVSDIITSYPQSHW